MNEIGISQSNFTDLSFLEKLFKKLKKVPLKSWQNFNKLNHLTAQKIYKKSSTIAKRNRNFLSLKSRNKVYHKT